MKAPCRMALWELRRRLNGFSAVPPMPPSVLTICASYSTAWVSKSASGEAIIFRKSGVEEKINLRREGSHAKPYQVKPVPSVILKARLGSKP